MLVSKRVLVSRRKIRYNSKKQRFIHGGGPSCAVCPKLKKQILVLTNILCPILSAQPIYVQKAVDTVQR